MRRLNFHPIGTRTELHIRSAGYHIVIDHI